VGLATFATASGAGWAPVLTAAVPTLVELESIGDGPETGEPVLCHNNLNPGNVRLGAGGRLIVVGWEHADGLPPEWELCAALSATALQNYVVGQVDLALNASGTEDQRYTDRNIRHLLTHLPSRATYEKVLDAALGRR
jgi:thiamine kinase-like enzyme